MGNVDKIWRVSTTREAEQDIKSAGRFQRKRGVYIHKQFHNRVKEALASLVRLPDVAKPNEHGVYRKNLRQFPYHLIYTAENTEVKIIALEHDRRGEPTWIERV